MYHNSPTSFSSSTDTRLGHHAYSDKTTDAVLVLDIHAHLLNVYIKPGLNNTPLLLDALYNIIFS